MAAITKDWLESELAHLRAEKIKAQEFLIRVEQHTAAFEQILRKLEEPEPVPDVESAQAPAAPEVPECANASDS